MPTPTGLPKPGEIWRLTQTLPVPGNPSEWRTEVVDVLVLERGRGDFWSLRVRGPDGKDRLWVDISYAWSRGKFKFVRNN